MKTFINSFGGIIGFTIGSIISLGLIEYLGNKQYEKMEKKI